MNTDKVQSEPETGAELRNRQAAHHRPAGGRRVSGLTDTIRDVLGKHWARSTHTEAEPAEDRCSGCGAAVYTWGSGKDPLEGLAAHQAEAVAAALTGQGWAQGAEEWGVRDSEEGVDEIEPPTREWAQRVADANNARLRRHGMDGDSTVVRRRVTPWEPAETGDQG